jgi:hypothetical protein
LPAGIDPHVNQPIALEGAMALTAFANTYTINHAITNPEIVAANQGDTMQVLLGTHPITSQPVVSSLTLDSTADPANETIWANAVNVAYNPVHDQITGNIFTLGPVEDNEQTYILRNFCMSLEGTPNSRNQHLHVYVSEGIYGGGDPDDGSWTGDTN